VVAKNYGHVRPKVMPKDKVRNPLKPLKDLPDEFLWNNVA
jgi:hypothetical protein